jgi:superfamily II DNA/RNA helicase
VYENYKHYYDFLIASQTGSGKTLSFAAPIVSDLISLSEKTPLPSKPLCLILTPTRELALQI